MDVASFQCYFYGRFVDSVIYEVDWYYPPFTIISTSDFKHYEISITVTKTITTTTTTTTTTTKKGEKGAKLTGGQVGYGYSGEGFTKAYEGCDNDAVLCGCQAVPENQIPAIQEVNAIFQEQR